MTIADMLASARKTITPLDAEVLLAHVVHLRREELLMRDRESVAEHAAVRFTELVARRAAGEPLAYLTGEKEFFGLTFTVDPRVLIPRPETELIVEEVVRWVKGRGAEDEELQVKNYKLRDTYELQITNNLETSRPRNLETLRLLDVGTGSGCIPITIKKYVPELHVAACDVSPDALIVAQGNAVRHEVAIHFRQSDLLADMPDTYDIVTANLPYVEERDAELAPGVEKFEPHLALFGGADGLDLYRGLLAQLAAWEVAPQLLLFECAPWQTEPLAALTRQAFPRHTVVILPDLAGHERLVRCTVE